jgi:hypothetical protein
MSGGADVGGPRWQVPIAPQSRGRVTPRIVDHLRDAGWTVHQVGQAIYTHSADDDLHLILGVWPRRVDPPPWADRLGRASDGYVRRWERLDREQHWTRLARDAAGRFLGLMQWWRWPAVRVYRWDRP